MNDSYWGLPSLSHCIRWMEELVAILSKPFLMIGFIVSTLDLLTNGGLLNIWAVSFGWALIQAVALDATFFVTWHKAKISAMNWRVLPFLGYAILGLALGVVAWAAMDLQSLEQALGIASPEAMSRLGLNPVMLVHLRSLVAVIMGGVVAMISPEATTAKRNETVKPFKLPLWAVKILSWLGIKPKTGGQSAPVPSPETPVHPTVSPETPATITCTIQPLKVARLQSRTWIWQAVHTVTVQEVPVLRLVQPSSVSEAVSPETPRETPDVSDSDTALEARVTALLEKQPYLSSRKVAELVDRPHSTVYRYVAKVKQQMKHPVQEGVHT